MRHSFLTADNHVAVPASARHQPKAHIERLVASLHPKPDVPAVIRKLPEPRRAVPDATTAPVMSMVQVPLAERQAAAPPGPAPAPAPAPVLTPLAPDRYKVQLTISRDTHDKLRRVQALARHTIPSGDPAEIFDRALTLLLHELERRRCAETSSPHRSRAATEGSRYIPAGVKREVWHRDEGQCVCGHERPLHRARVPRVPPCAAVCRRRHRHGGQPSAAMSCTQRVEASLFFGRADPECVRETRSEYGDVAQANAGSSAA